MRRGEQYLDPILSAARGAEWRRWLTYIITTGRRGLAWLGLTLLLGFATGALAIYLFVEIADEVMDGDTERLDNAALGVLQGYSSPAFDSAANVITLLGSEVLAVLLVVLLVAFVLGRRWGTTISLLVVTGGAQLLNGVLKSIFERTRPSPVEWLTPGQEYSFPSGHAMVSAAFYLFLAYLSWHLLHGRWRLIVTGGLMLLIFLIGLTRLYLGVHYLTDVVAGYIAGFIWVETVIIGGHLLRRRRRDVSGDGERSCSTRISTDGLQGRN